MGDIEVLTKFAPTETEQRVLDIFQAHDYNITVGDACKEGGISRQRWYQWFGKPGFSEWWQTQGEKWAARQAPRVYGALARSAAGGHLVGGNPTDRRTYLERFDKGFMPTHRNVNQVQIEAVESKIKRCLTLADQLEAETVPLLEAEPIGGSAEVG